ncbi:hypothetical protein [Winogradskyella sp.]|uniref:hypothetical protein n=1 Tax=Winogradskyella sp. TaxID=1883156 RepID=UPI003BAD39A0
MRTKILGLLLITLIVFTSCQKDDVESNEETVQFDADISKKYDGIKIWNEKFQMYELILFNSPKAGNGNVYFHNGGCSCSVSYYNAATDQNMAPVSISCTEMGIYRAHVLVQVGDNLQDDTIICL